ncbi:hypothetical protein [Mucilaginibacter sp. FT3.2]|uniref:hypothetical protein n=1 Tax=Mucilaginibacter sp. FT3.2 TaxID=2723090 RepID=UPI00160BA77B|nr:hypothetical protein [Mucilaginibacter sp. FT3.2]MBB6231246.1 hypothetical protein [Mucilaginibacter sp. FT3.2]
MITYLPVTAQYINTVNTAHPTAIKSKANLRIISIQGSEKIIGAQFNDHIFYIAG